MVHLHPDYPEPSRVDSKSPRQRKCCDGLCLALIFFLMLITMIGLECMRRDITRNETITVEERPGGSVFGAYADNQIKPEKPFKDGGILLGNSNGRPAVTTLVGTPPSHVTVAHGTGFLTWSTPQDMTPTNADISIGTTSSPATPSRMVAPKRRPTICEHYGGWTDDCEYDRSGEPPLCRCKYNT